MERPYCRLNPRRKLRFPELPTDLANFYCGYEGVGLASEGDHSVRLCRLDEVVRIGWSDVHILGAEPLDGWESFDGYRIGIGMFFDEIVYVINAPVCTPGSILALGVDVAGPGGIGEYTIEPSLVLAETFSEWIDRLERCKFVEYGLCPGGLSELVQDKELQLRLNFKRLNPLISWGVEG